MRDSEIKTLFAKADEQVHVDEIRKQKTYYAMIEEMEKQRTPMMSTKNILLHQFWYMDKLFFAVYGVLICLGIIFITALQYTGLNQNGMITVCMVGAGILSITSISVIDKLFFGKMAELGESCYFNTKQCVAAWLVLSGMINVMILFLIAGYLNYHWSVGLLQVGLYILTPYLVSSITALGILSMETRGKNSSLFGMSAIFLSISYGVIGSIPRALFVTTLWIWAVACLLYTSTVLKGPLAAKQSKALIRTFKKMKDYILENRDLIGLREILQLSMETANNRIEINKINSDMIYLEKQISDVAEGLKDVVTKSELADMMNSFVSDDDDKWLMFNAKFSSADEVYESIYKQAKSSIYVVDNSIGLRTLVHLKNSPAGVVIILFSDNVGNNKLHNIEFIDFCKEYPTVNLSMKKTGGIFHDRFIVLDYGTDDERVFLCGASSKDAGARITSIVEDYGISKYASVIATLLKNPTLILPQ